MTAEHFKKPTTYINQLWQTNLTCFKIIGWDWYNLSSVLDDFSRNIPRYYNEARYHESLDNVTRPMFTSGGPSAS